MADKKKNKNIKDKHIRITKKYLDYYYMAVDEIGAKELYEVICNAGHEVSERIELWDAADVLEIETDEKSSIDIEKIPWFNNEDDKKFLESNGIKSIFSIKTDEPNRQRMIDIFKLVISSLGGFVCSDTDNFMPYIVQ